MAYSVGMGLERLTTDPDRLSRYERAWIAGWLTAKNIGEPTYEQFRDALLALVAVQTQSSTAHH